MTTNLDRLKADLQKLTPSNRIFVWAGWDIDPFSDDQLRQYLFTRDEMIAALSGQPVPQPTIIEVTVTSPNGLRVRATAPAGTVLTVLPNGTRVRVFEIQDVSGWWKIAEGQYTGGYISAEYAKAGVIEPTEPTPSRRNKIGYHIMTGAKREMLDDFARLHAAKRPVPLVTLVFAGNPDRKSSAFSVTDIKRVSPSTIVIARDMRGNDYHADDVGGWDRTTRAHGLDYFNRHRDFLTDDIRKADFIQIRDLNEPGEGYGTNAWWEGALDGADKERVKLAVYNFSVGNPSLPGERDEAGNLRQYNDFWQWTSTIDLLRRVKRDKHAFCLHQYAYRDQWDPKMRDKQDNLIENTLLYRHRAILRVLPADLKDIPIYFNEWGESYIAPNTPPDRSPERYAQRVATAQSELEKDANVVGADYWNFGNGGNKDWDKDELNHLRNVMEAVAMTTEPMTDHVTDMGHMVMEIDSL